MKTFFTAVIIVLLNWVLVFSQSISKVGTTAATFLEIGVGPSNGMGGAFVSIANDATALYWNVAGIATLDRNDVSISHMNWLAGIGLDYAALAIPLGDFGTIGASLTSVTMGQQKVRTVDLPEGTGEYYTASDIAVGISYSRSLTDKFSIGITGKYIQETIWHMGSNAIAFDFGTLLKTDLIGGLTIGASLSNFGTKMKLSGIDTRTYYSVAPEQLGTNSQIPYVIALDSWSLPLLFRIGVSTKVVNNNTFQWVVAADALHPNDNYESLNVGSQLSYQGFLFARIGYQSLFLKDGEGGLTFGFGVTSKMLFSNTPIKFDYSYRNFGRLGYVGVFSLGIQF